MTHAGRIIACPDCKGESFDAVVSRMKETLLGEVDPDEWLCPRHKQEIEAATLAHMIERRSLR